MVSVPAVVCPEPVAVSVEVEVVAPASVPAVVLPELAEVSVPAVVCLAQG